MSSDERFQEGDASAGSFDTTSKKKKSFNPLRSLKRFFGHGDGSSSSNSSSRRQRLGEINGSDDTCNSVLPKARSTTDVVIVTDEKLAEDESVGLQKQCKPLSLSADSIFSVERTSDPGRHISAEALLSSEGGGTTETLQCKDEDEGLPQSPFTLTTTADLFVEKGNREPLEKWPSFDSGHSLLSVDSNENEVEEDFFKDKWFINSKLSLCGEENDVTSCERSFQSEVDLNLVQRHTSLNCSAAVHRLAVRPKGKRISSIYQQKLGGSSLKQPTLLTSLPLVKEENGTGGKAVEDGHSSNSLTNLTTLSCNTERLDKETETTTANSGKKSDVKKLEQELDISIHEQGNGLLEGDKILQRQEDVMLAGKQSDREKKSSNLKENADEISTAEKTVGDADAFPGKQASTSSGEIVRRKPPRPVMASPQEISEMAAKRRTFAFQEETGSVGEKPTSSKRSSLIISDRSLVPSDTGNTELAQMFNRFQRRSSQKKQNQVEDTKPLEVKEDDLFSMMTASDDTKIKEQQQLGRVTMDSSLQKTNLQGIGKADGGSDGKLKNTVKPPVNSGFQLKVVDQKTSRNKFLEGNTSLLASQQTIVPKCEVEKVQKNIIVEKNLGKNKEEKKKEKSTDCDSALIPPLCVHG